ncbi:hypothetical protein LKL54_13145, partial [Listeria monocytogenes ATCC 19115]|nr:hypothetical protein [Listeria monocytogenes ATCC 19115]
MKKRWIILFGIAIMIIFGLGIKSVSYTHL